MKFPTSLLFVLLLLFTSGCTHVPPGGVKESHVSFGIPSVFKVSNDTTNLSATDKNVRVGDTEGTVQILLFELKHSQKGVVIPNPPEAKEKAK